jgi:hypothetical protein
MSANLLIDIKNVLFLVSKTSKIKSTTQPICVVYAPTKQTSKLKYLKTTEIAENKIIFKNIFYYANALRSTAKIFAM